jgi:hypothetical protein
MLNELRELSVSLEKAGIKVEDLHPNFKSCPKYLSYWVYLDKQGNVSGVAPVPATQVQGIRKWEKANGVSFPAFNMPPLFKAEHEVLQSQIKGMRKSIEKGAIITAKELLTSVKSCEPLWDKGITKKLADCFAKPIVDIAKQLEAPPNKYKSIAELISRAQRVKVPAFQKQLADSLLRNVQDAPATHLIDTLFSFGDSTPKNFQIILELADSERFEYPANHREVQRWMNKQFLRANGNKSSPDLDAYGCNATGKNSKFPPIGFKNALGNVILRAMSKESPCQARYGMIDYHSFPAGEEVRKGMKGSLEWLGDEERKGKTWCDLSRRMEKPMLLFAYPAAMPKDMPDLASMMGDAEDDTVESSQERFSSLAEKVTIALRGGMKEAVDSEIRIFILSKRKGDARTKVLTSNRYATEHVIHSAKNWQVGCRNIPPIMMRCFGKAKGDEAYWGKPLIPFPAEIVWCLNTVWTRYGKYAEAAHGFSMNDALSLLLDEGAVSQQLAVRALNTVIRNSSSILLSMGQATTQGLVQELDKSCWKYLKQKQLLPSTIGLLLHKIQRKKGEFMTSSTFLVGRLLSLADQLHLEYCRHVRNNSVPPQLVGNALMATAQEEPVKALSLLWGRIKPYHAWAQTLKEGDNVGLVKYFLKNLGDISEQLQGIQLPQRCTDTDKAQMLLGYLSRTESNK